MSSSIDTNVGARQGPQPQSQSLSQMLDGPYTIPVADMKKTVDVKSQAKKLVRKVIWKNLCSKMENAGFSYELDLEEQALTSLEASAVTITSTITTVVRQIHKGKEYLVWYTIEQGFDKNGVAVIGSGAYIPHGLDKDCVFKEIRNADGEVVKLQMPNVFTDIYTEEFSPDKLTELLNNNTLDERIQFSFTNQFGKSYGGYNSQEMIHLSSNELQTRGQLGKAGEDLSIEYSSLTAKDKLFLQSQAPK